MDVCRRRLANVLTVACLVSTLPAAGPNLLAAREEVRSAQASRVAPTPGPEHYYVGRQADAFVYEKVPVDGIQTEQRILVWFLGVSEPSEPVVRYQDGPSTGTLRCYDDCQFVMGVTTIGGKLTQTGRIRVTNDPLISAIMHDARSGALSQR